MMFLAVWGPSLAGVLLTWWIEGGSAVKRLLSRLTIVQVGWKWWAAAVVLPLALQGGAVVLASFFIDVRVDRLGPGTWSQVTYFLTIGLLSSPFGEEIGWRGFALPRLLERMSALSAALVIWIVWAVWHLPAFIVPGVAKAVLPEGLTLTAFACFALPAIVLVTWVYLNGRRSLLLAVLFHFAIVLQQSALGGENIAGLVWSGVACFALAAAA